MIRVLVVVVLLLVRTRLRQGTARHRRLTNSLYTKILHYSITSMQQLTMVMKELLNQSFNQQAAYIRL